MSWEGIAAIITAIGTIVLGWFQYNQSSKDKIIDYKIETWRKEGKERYKRDKETSSRIFGSLWRILYELHASRVYVIQPHPLTHALHLSVYYEARDNGVMQMSKRFDRMPIGDVAGFASELRSRDFIFWPSADEIKDNHARAIMRNAGAETLVIKRLSDDRHDWIGSIVVDYSQPTNIELPYVKGMLYEVANDIQYTLPEIDDKL